MSKRGETGPLTGSIVMRFALRYVAVLLAAMMFLLPVYWQTLTVVRESAVSDSMAMLEEGLRILDYELVKMSELANIVRNEQHYIHLVRLNDDQIQPRDYYVMDAAQRFMKPTLLPSNAILCAYFLFDKNSLSIAPDRIYRNRLEMFEPYLGIQGTSGEAWLEEVLAQTGSTFFPSTTYFFRQAMLSAVQRVEAVAYVVPVNNGNVSLRSDSRMVFLLDTQWILRLLTGGLVGEGSLRVIDAQGQTILGYNAQALPEQEEQDGVRRDTLDGQSMVIMTLNQSLRGLRVTVGIPERIFLQRIQSVMNLIALYLCLGLACGLVVALILAYRNSRPLSKLITLAESIVHPSQREGDAYDYVSQALEKLRLVNAQYCREVADLNSAIKTNLFDKLLSQDLDWADEGERVRRFLPFLERPFRITVMRLWRAEDLEEARSVELAKVAAMNAMREQLQGEVFFHSVLPGCVVACLTQAARSAPEVMDAALTRCAERVFEKTGVRLVIGVSGLLQGHGAMRAAYVQALEAMRTVELDHGPVSFYAKDRPTVSVLCGMEEIQHLHEALLAGNHSSAQAIIEAVYARCQALGQLEEELIRRVYYSIQNTILFASRGPHMEGSILDSVSGYSEVKTLAELFDQLQANARRLCDEVEGRKKSRNIKLRTDVAEYIRSHHTDGSLCAASVSAHLGISEKYLFSFVREQTGKTFGDYLSDLRLEHAVTLLSKSEASIAEIAQAVGFNSPNTFYKVFRRSYGVSPGVWRENNRSKRFSGSF